MNGVHRTNNEGINGDGAIDLSAEPDFSVGALLVRPSLRSVVIDGTTEMIEPRVMQVLIVLSRRRGDVVSRDQLVDECWTGRVVGDDAITRCIAKVRRLASANTFELETIPRIGYRLVAAHSPTSEPAPIVKRAKSHRRKWLLIASAIVLVMTAGYFAGSFYMMQLLGASSFSEMRDLIDPGERPKIAVLPFDAVGVDADSRYLADAIPAAINNQLVNLGFQVVSPAVAFQYRGERKARAGVELGPRYVIDGSLRIEGDKIQVIARVDSAPRPVSVWSQTFEADLHTATKLPDRIATGLASLQIFNAATRSAQYASAPNVVAGTTRLTELMRAGDDMGAYLFAKELLHEKSGVFSYQVFYGIAVAAALDMIPLTERANALTEARKITDRAASSSPQGAPFAIQSLMPTVNWADRERVLRAGMETYPTTSSFRYAIALLLSHAGRVAEATSFAHEAIVIDPLSSTNMLTYAGVLDTAGKYEEADVLFSRADRLWPNLELLQLTHFPAVLMRGDLENASATLNDPALQKILNPPAEQRPYESIVRALATHKPADIEAVERECSDPSKQARRRSGPCLIAFAKLDRVDKFFAVAPNYFPEQRGATAAERDAHWLENPLAWRNLRLLFRSDLAALRTDPRIIPIFERMGLIDYWRASGKWPDFCATEPKSVCARIQGQVK